MSDVEHVERVVDIKWRQNSQHDIQMHTSHEMLKTRDVVIKMPIISQFNTMCNVKLHLDCQQIAAKALVELIYICLLIFKKLQYLVEVEFVRNTQ